jgi:type I restriction enzyme M protein
MSTQSSTIIQRLWNYCNALRDDGMSYGDYVEQLTYLLFLKMDQEGSTMLGKHSAIPPGLQRIFIPGVKPNLDFGVMEEKNSTLQ